MDTPQVLEKNWAELKGKIQSQWIKFNEEDLERIKGDVTQVAAKIQKVYGVAKEEADRQFEDFKKTVQDLLHDDSSKAPHKPRLNVAAS